jgi:hypothetical protein
VRQEIVDTVGVATFTIQHITARPRVNDVVALPGKKRGCRSAHIDQLFADLTPLYQIPATLRSDQMIEQQTRSVHKAQLIGIAVATELHGIAQCAVMQGRPQGRIVFHFISSRIQIIHALFLIIPCLVASLALPCGKVGIHRGIGL